MDIKFNYNDTISTVNSSKPSVVDSGKKDPVLLKSDKSSDTVLPITQVENEVNTDDVITSSGKRYIIEIGDKDETYTTDHTRNFYRGRSFRFAGPWTEGVHYISDNYVVDFVVKDNTLLACTKSHMSSSENEPTEWVIEDGQKRGVISDYWDLVIAGVPGKQGGVYLPSYDEETDRLVWTLVPAEDLDSPIYVYLGITDRINSAIGPINERITQLNSEILDLNLITTSLSERVSNNEGNIGQLWLKADEFGVRMENAEGEIGQLTLTAHEFGVQMSNIQGDVGRLWLTAEEFGVRMSNAEGDISQLTQTADEIQTRVENAEGDISQIHQRADEIWTQVENNQGDISRISQRADQIQSQVENNAGDISTLTQRANEISSQVENAQGDISQLRQTATEISATVESNKQLADGAIAENRSLISQTAEQIRTEVESNVTRLDGEIEQNRSEIRQTAEEITTTVERNKQETDGAIESARSEFKQTADEISATVERNKIDVDGQIDAARSEIRQTADEITATVEANKRDTDGSIAELNSTITQTAEEIRADVSRVETDLTGNIESAKSEFRQTADEISTTVEQNKQSTDGAISNLSSEITQTAEQIRSEVSASITDVNGQIAETRSELRQTADEITSTVEANKRAADGSIEELDSRITQTATEIRSEVSESITDINDNLATAKSEIDQLSDEIDLKVSQAEFDSKTGDLTQSISDILVDTSGIHQTVSAISGSLDTTTSAFNDYVLNTNGVLEEIQKQIDGAIETWFYPYAPIDTNPESADYNKILTNVAPYSEWLAEDTESGGTAVRDAHIADIFYDTASGFAYRFTSTGEGASKTYNWVLIEDSAVVRALRDAATAQATADGKMKVFVQTPPAHPEPPYEVGDLWAQGSLEGKNGLIYKCVVAKTENQTYSSNDWALAFDAVTTSVAKSSFDLFADAIQGKVWQEDINGIISGDTYSSVKQTVNNINLSVASVRNDLLATGIDISGVEYDDQGKVVKGGTVTITADNFILQGNKPGADRALELVYDTNGIPRISAANLEVEGVFSTQAWSNNLNSINSTASGYASAAQAAAESTAQGYANTAENNAKGYADTKKSEAINEAINSANTYVTTLLYGEGGDASNPESGSILYAINTLDGNYNNLDTRVSDMGYLARALWDGDTAITGGLIASSLIQLGSKTYNGNDTPIRNADGTETPGELNQNTWKVWSGISGVYVPSAIGGGIAAWYGGEMLDRAIEGNDDSKRAANSLFRFDGSGYLSKGKISWDDTGSLYIDKNVVVGDNNETLNSLVTMLADFRSWFEVVPIVIDGVNRKALHLKTGTDVELAGFYADGFISAGGLSTGGGAEGVDIIAVWQSLTNQSSDTTYNNTKIARAHLPIATENDLGAVKIGSGLAIAADGTISSNSGTVTSIGLSMPTGFTVTDSPVTSSGTITVTFAEGYSLPSTSSQTAWNAKYDKPATGIPKSDLAEAVRNSLDLANSALQSHQSLGLYAGALNGTANTKVASNPYILLTGGGANKGNVQLKGAGSVSIASNATGVITITGVNTTYKTSINGTDYGDTTNGVDLGTIYAPSTSGTEGYILMANTSGIPTWHSLTQSDVFGSSDIGSNSLPVYYNGTNGLSVITSLSLQGDIVTTTKVKAPRFYLTDDIYFVVDEHGVKLEGAGFYTDEFVSAGGYSPGGGAEGISWEALTTSGEQKIHASHLPITVSQNEGNYVTGITYSGGTFTVTRASLATTIGWDSVDDKPTTLAGYGITDGVNKVTVSGSGNAVTTASISGHTLTLTKGTTFLTTHQTVKLETGTNNGTLKLTVGSTVTDNIAVKGLGAAAYKAVGSVASGNTGLVTGGDVYTAINDVVTSAIKFRGVTSSELSDGDTSSTIIIDDSSYTAKSGDLVLSGGLEFLWTGSKWQLLGDESSYVLKTTTVNGHALTGNITISKSDVGLGNVTNLAATGYFTLFEMDSTDTTKTSITIGGTNKKLVIGYATKAKQDADGNEIKTSYGASLGAAANALTLKAKDGTILSTLTAANIVTVLGNTAVGRATGDKIGNDIYATYISGVAVGTGSGNTNKLAITKAGNTTYITVPYATLANTVTTTADTTNELYLVGVTSNATTTLKRNNGIKMLNGNLTVTNITAEKFYFDSNTYFELDANGYVHLVHPTGKGFYADGFVSAGGLNTSGSGGGSGVSFVNYATIKTLASDEDFTTASAWATHLFYQDVFGSGNSTIVSRITALENSSTNVQYTAKQTSGTEIGTITIDGTANKIYAPTIPTSLKNPKALSFGTQSYDGSAAKTIEAKDLSACVVGTVVGTVTITT